MAPGVGCGPRLPAGGAGQDAGRADVLRHARLRSRHAGGDRAHRPARPVPADHALLDDVDRTGPESAVETFRGTIEGIITHTGGAGTLLIVGLISAIASATAWLDAFVRIAGDIHGSRVTDGFVRRKTRHAVTAIAYGLCLSVLGVLVVVTGPISARRGDAVGAGDATITARSTAKWPAALVLGVTMVAGLLGSPRAPPPPSRERSYGALGGVVVFLIWMWITHAALIVGLATADRLGGPRPG